MVSGAAHADPFNEVASRFHLDPLLLKAIAAKESKNENSAVNTNTNQTEDVCMMGINSSHYAQLRRFGITRTRLLSEPKVCIATGAYILNNFFEHYGRSWDSLGMYNTGPNPKLKSLRASYAASVREIYLRLTKESGTEPHPFSD
nr:MULTISPECIES: lytic transglycosylase domain-containing protein [Pantoea]